MKGGAETSTSALLS